MFRVKTTFSQFLLGTALAMLSACGKPLKRPELPSPPPLPVDQIILRDHLSAVDLKSLFRVLNQKGEFNSLLPWTEKLSDSQVEAWAKFLSEWVYEDAQTSRGLVQLLNKRNEKKGFSQWKKLLEQSLKETPGLQKAFLQIASDDQFYPLLKRDIGILDPDFLKSVLPALLEKTKTYNPSNPEKRVNTEQLVQDLQSLLSDPAKMLLVLSSASKAVEGDALTSLMRAGTVFEKNHGPEAFSKLALEFSKHSEFLSETEDKKQSNLGQALALADLLNRPAGKIISALQEGLKSNPDLVQALNLKWDPLFVKALSEIVLEVLLNPEDGTKLDKNFWLALPRKNEGDVPTAEFSRLYAIIFSGIQKITDSRRLESQGDSGSYRLPLQLNALFMTSLLENLVRAQRPQLESLSSKNFESSFWDLATQPHVFKLSLNEASDKKKLSLSVRRDLESLGLSNLISRLENLLTQEDFGRSEYDFSLSEGMNFKQVLSEALAYSQSIRPFSDVTPFLVATIHHFGSKGANSPLSLESMKAIPNLLVDLQSFLGALSTDQWKGLKKILFEDFKISHLEMEDRMLLVGLFQSDPEVAEWVNQVLVSLESVELLDQKTEGSVSLFEFYHLILQTIGKTEVKLFSDFLSGLYRLEIFSSKEDGTAVYPGVLSIVQSGDGVGVFLKSISGLNLAQQKLLSQKFFEAFGCDHELQNGVEAHLAWLASFLIKNELPGKKALFDFLGKRGWSLIPSQEILETPEREWAIDFTKKGGLESLVTLLKDQENPVPVSALIENLKQLSKKKVFEQGFQLLGQMENERVREVSRVLLKMDRSGELLNLFEVIETFSYEGEKI